MKAQFRPASHRILKHCIPYIVVSTLLAGCLEGEEANVLTDQSSLDTTEQSADTTENSDKVTAVVYEDGSVTLDWPVTEGAVEYVIYRNGDFVENHF